MENLSSDEFGIKNDRKKKYGGYRLRSQRESKKEKKNNNNGLSSERSDKIFNSEVNVIDLTLDS